MELFSASELASFYRYFSSRFKWPVVLLLPCFLICLSAFAAGEWHPSRLFADFLVALSMIVPFRLADDLADRKRDQSRHADRELCTTDCLRSYAFALVVVSSLALFAVLATRGTIAITLLLATVLVAAFWYKVRGALQASVICNYHVVLLKYAVFELVLIDPKSWQIPIEAWWSSLTAYVVLLLWEVAHDSTHRNSVTSKRLAMIEFLSWLLWTLWFVLRT